MAGTVLHGLDCLLDLVGKARVARAASGLAIRDNVGKGSTTEPTAIGRHVHSSIRIDLSQHGGEIKIRSGVDSCLLAGASATHKCSVNVATPPTQHDHPCRTGCTQLTDAGVSHDGSVGQDSTAATLELLDIFAERGYKLTRDRAGFAIADGAVVELDHRYHFRGGTRQE